MPQVKLHKPSNYSSRGVGGINNSVASAEPPTHTSRSSSSSRPLNVFTNPLRRVRFCLASPSGFLVDISNQQISDESAVLWAEHPEAAQQFVSFDKACDVAKTLNNQCFQGEPLTVEPIVFLYDGNNTWRQDHGIA